MSGPLFGAPYVDDVLTDDAYVRVMLAVEAALASASAEAGLISTPAAVAIVEACQSTGFDAASIGRRAVAHATPVVPLVEDLRAAVPVEFRSAVHTGATSQDIIDTALCLMVRDALGPILGDLAAIGDRLAALARTHAADVQMGRTMLQHAMPTTFGLVVAGWLTGLDAAIAGLVRIRDCRLAIQLGGPVGAQAGFGGHGPAIAAGMAGRLGLTDPGTPWHTDRQRIGEVASAIALAGAALAMIGRNVAMLAQTEVGEVSEGSAGRSSAMPHKRNPARSVLVVACAEQIPGIAAGVLAGLAGEAQRSIGTWQAEVPAVRRLLGLLGGAAMHCRAVVTDLQIDTERMRSRVEGPTDDLVASAHTLITRALGQDRPYLKITTTSRLSSLCAPPTQQHP